MLTNDKFCFIHHGKLKLTWWRKPLHSREIALQQRQNNKEKMQGGTDETSVESSRQQNRKERRATPLGHGLPARRQVGAQSKGRR
jgi:hypothetical protein